MPGVGMDRSVVAAVADVCRRERAYYEEAPVLTENVPGCDFLTTRLQRLG